MRLRRIAVALLVGVMLAGLVGLAGCAGRPTERGFRYTVERGDTLYALGRRFGVHHDRIQRANQVTDVTQIRPGQTLWIPTRQVKVSESSKDAVRQRARSEARRDAALAFSWPVKGRLTSRFGKRNGRKHEGVDLAAPRGTAIRAAEAGKVIHSGRLAAYGKVVILKHGGHYRTVYAHASKTLVRKGEFVERGQLIAKVGSTGRSTGPHLHFEIRHRENPRDPMLYLP